MKIPEEAICSVCKRIFCCGKCREKHEIKSHAIRIVRKYTENSAGKEPLADSIFKLCPICVNRPFPLHEVIYHEMLEHIKRHHLPLHCQKCAKVYVKIDDLREFSKCVQPVPLSPGVELKTQTLLESSCILKTATKSKTQQNTISTQTTPNLAVDSSITPISIVNFHWKAKSKALQDVSDSVSSLKNISLITNSISMRRSIGPVTQIETKGKLVRSTSTPLHSGTEYAKPKDQTFNASGGQVSSIYNSGGERDSQNSQNAVIGGSTSTLPQPDAVNLYKKFNTRTKIATVTPLRQVMSKSIQKAFAEHGLPPFSEQKQHNAVSDDVESSPLDLRLSPALRRCNSDSTYAKKSKNSEKADPEAKYQKLTTTPLKQQVFHKRLMAGKQFKTESIMITHTKQLSCFQTSDDQSSREEYNSCSTVNSVSTNSVYKTCQSFEIITSTELGEINVTQNAISSDVCNNELASITPITRLPGSSINKKIIKFETPRIESKSKCKTNSTEKFYTPITSPELNEENVPVDLTKLTVVRNLSARFSPSSRRSIRDCAQSTAYSHYEVEGDDADSNDEVFTEKTNINLQADETQQTGPGGILKSIVDTVWRLPSFKEKPNTINQRPSIHAKTFSKPSIIKRCASIAGSLVRSASSMDENQLQTLKRKRTNTIDVQLSPYRAVSRLGSVTSPDAVAVEHSLSSTKRFRIQGRKPIERMRNTSS